MFKGSIVAIVTPFKKNKIDEKSLKTLIEFQIKNGTNGIVPCGTTGESPTVSYEEHNRIVEICVKQAAGRVPVIAGTGSNSTQEAIELTRHAKKVGADASLQVAPYYNKPSQRGIYEHFKAIADAVRIPIIVYNIMSRTGINIEAETIARLAHDCKNIVGIKEASGSLEQMSRIKQACPPGFDVLSGDDALTLPLLAVGGTGVISVAANIIPADVAGMCKAFERGDLAEARRLHYKILPLVKALFIETNPVPVKTAMGIMRMCAPDIRLPLAALTEENREKMKAALKSYGLI